jgi:glycine oxidase
LRSIQPGNAQTTDVAIIGGGVIGLAVARALALRGVRGVVVLERTGPGSEASSAAAGMLAPQAEADQADDFFRLACQSRDLYPSFAAQLKTETGIDIEFDTTGTLYLALTEADEEEIAKRYEWQSRAGLPVERLSADDARHIEPCISEDVVSALRFPLDVQVENRRLVGALSESAKQLGVSLLTGVTVSTVRINNEVVAGLETSQGFISTRNVVVAAGAWSSAVVSSDKRLPQIGIQPVRGQMVCLESSPRLARHVIYSPRGYIVPRVDGRLLAGSTSEHAGFDKRVTAAGIHSILSDAMDISPDVAGLPLVDSWAGLRPRAPDNLPVLGPYAEIEGLFYATGHYRNGILLTPITGDLLAEAIIKRTNQPLLEPFSPNRFRSVGAKEAR